MDILSVLGGGLVEMLTPGNLLVMITGLVFGIIGGMLPGIATVTAIALFVPFTFVMSPTTALCALGACYTGATYGGANASILINTPGQPASFVTTLDGYPMTLKGKAEEALYYALLASSAGGLFGAFMLLFFYQPLSSLGLKFGSESFFWMGILGLTTLSAMFPGNVARSLAAGLIGLGLSTVGLDPRGALPRFTFGYFPLVQGLDMVVLMIAFFSISQMLSILEDPADYIARYERDSRAFFHALRVMAGRCKRLLLISCGLGTLIGMLPGAGGNVAAIISYNEARRWSKHPEQFGTGIAEGIVAPESANNASVGGALIPLMALGIPGSASAAVLAGGLLAQGMMPGPTMLEQNSSVAFGFIVSLILAQIVLIPVGYVLAKICTRILDVPKYYVIPSVITLSFCGAYALRSSLFDLLVLVIAGGLAYLCAKVKLPPVSMGLGVVLGPIIEESMIITIDRCQNSNPLDLFLFSPMSIFFIICCIVIIILPLITGKKHRRTTNEGVSGQRKALVSGESLALVILGVIAALYLYAALQLKGNSWIFPAFIAVSLLVLIPFCLYRYATCRPEKKPLAFRPGIIAVYYLIMTAGYFLIRPLGLYTSMFLCMAAMLVYSTTLRNMAFRAGLLLHYALVSIAVVGVQYLVFVHFLHIEAPESMFLI